MKILVIGSGGREHALVWKLAQSPQVEKIYAAPGSAAIGTLAECVALNSHQEMARFAQENAITLTVVGPEVALVEGVADLFASQGLKLFGPTAYAAQLEGSKAFAKGFMNRHGIPTAAHAAFTQAAEALAHLDKTPGPWVVKADGLAAGKGVTVATRLEEAKEAVRQAMVAGQFGPAGAQVVIEQFLEGEEASYFVITDGKDFVALPACQDHKRLGNLDTGPNTGGMGAYCPAPIVTPEVERRVREEIVRPTLDGLAAEGHPYTGVLYVGLMIQDEQPSVVEYNCRFGDPECQPLMMALDSDLAPLLLAAVEGRLRDEKPAFRPGAAAALVMASGGYPGDYAKGFPIRGLHDLESSPSLQIFHAGTAQDNQGRWTTNGGRVLSVTSYGDNLAAALEKGYQALGTIGWDGAVWRDDIGLKALKAAGPHRPSTNVGIILGSASDLPVAKKATQVLDRLGIGYELAVASAHRTPERVRDFIHACETVGVEVFIAMAGMAAALPGVVAAETTLPVIGVPVAGQLELDALLSIAQMPPGIPVATVAVNGGVNAGVLAAHMLAIKYPAVRAALKEYRLEQKEAVAAVHRENGLSSFLP